jgi:glycosyltransferase involved in cell wall biosynthesis
VAIASSHPAPAADAPAATVRPRVTVVFHLADITGPARTLAPRLAALADRMDVEVVLPAPGRATRLFEPHSHVTCLPYASATFPDGAVEAARAGARLARDVVLLRRHLRARQPDLVIVVATVLPAPLLAARLERVPSLVYAAEILDRGHVGGLLRGLGAAATARLVRQLARCVVACSETVAAQFRGGPADVRVIYPGIPPQIAGGSRGRLRPGDNCGPCLAVVGSITPGRGQDVAVRALAALRASLPNAHLLLAGAPHPRPSDLAFERRLRKLAGELGVAGAVSFLGHEEDVADVYAAADVVVNPARASEGFGRAAVEALAAGRPVVASRVGAVPEVLRDGVDAFLIPPDDPDALGSAIRRLLTDDALARSFVERGRTRVIDQFAEERGVATFCEVVDRALRAPTG